MSALESGYVEKYARGPSPTTVEQAVATHTSIRTLLGDTDYATLLQGSYKNDTALWDMNDVDIVAVSRGLVSRAFGTNASNGAGTPWDTIFRSIEARLQGDSRYAGKWNRGDKCIRVNTGVRVDIVPAVRIGSAEDDPIAIYSFRALRERQNWPRTHYDAGAAKSRATSGAFKSSVRLFKRFAKSWFGDRKVAPSFYIECTLATAQDSWFTGNLAADFVTLSRHICSLSYGTHQVPRLAGGGNLLSPDEWDAATFAEFQHIVRSVHGYAAAALAETNEERARASWRAAFNGREPT